MFEIREAFTEFFDAIRNHQGRAKFVGGCVRDYLIASNFGSNFTFYEFIESRPTIDIDIATDLKPDLIAQIFNSKTTLATNIVIIKGIKMEVTTLRKDVKCFGRGVEFEYSNSFKEDAIRRDFTLNAIYMGQDGEIYDPNGGVEDLKNGVVKFIGDPNLRIKEDYLRILRFVRFSARFANQVNQSGLNACSVHIPQIDTLPTERITDEILKMIDAPKLIHHLEIFKSRGILQHIFKTDKFSQKALLYYNPEEFGSIAGSKFCLYWVFSNRSKNAITLTKRHKRIINTHLNLCQTPNQNTLLWLWYKYRDIMEEVLLIMFLEGGVDKAEIFKKPSNDDIAFLESVKTDVLSAFKGSDINREIEKRVRFK